MTAIFTIYGTVREDQAATVLLYVVGNNAVPITQATINAISLKVFDLDSSAPTTALQTLTPVVADSVFDSPQLDDMWEGANSIGYNFRYEILGTAFATGGHQYKGEVLFDPVVGEDFFGDLILNCLEGFTS